MWLVLCSESDAPGLWAHRELEARGVDRVELVTAETLERCRGWEHRVTSAGAFVELTLPDGRWINSSTLRGVLNRLLMAPSSRLMLAHPRDRDYVNQELTAFFMSWLYALPEPVLNRPTPLGLSGEWRHASQWICLAAQSGLRTPPYRQSGYDLNGAGGGLAPLPPSSRIARVIAVAGALCGEACPAEVSAACLRLACRASTPLLGVDLAVGPGGEWTFAGATPLPDLRIGGAALIERLQQVFQSGAQGARETREESDMPVTSEATSTTAGGLP